MEAFNDPDESTSSLLLMHYMEDLSSDSTVENELVLSKDDFFVILSTLFIENSCSELLKHASSEATKAVMKFNRSTRSDFDASQAYNYDKLLESESEQYVTGRRKKTCMAARAGLQFDPDMFAFILSRVSALKLSFNAIVGVTAVLEYICAELLELSGNCARDWRLTGTCC